jgi:hypothetical protein
MPQVRLLKALAIAIACAIVSSGLYAQTTTRITGAGRLNGDDPRDYSDITFKCDGEPTCVGTYTELAVEGASCNNPLQTAGALTISGVDLSRAGNFAGTMRLDGFGWQLVNVNRVCSIAPGAQPVTLAYQGTWDGSSGTLSFSFQDDADTVVRFTSTFKAERAAPPPVFPLQVQASFDTTANVTATFQPRPQDVGTQANVYVFAVAPITVVKSAQAKAAHYGHIARGDNDTPVQCVLAQLSSSGQLTGVSASNMQAYVTGVLSGQGQAVTMLNGVPVANVAGATFYLGYGTSASAMLDNGINRSAATAPGAAVCKPEPPETGWWWNIAEGGRGYSVEVQGHNIFFAAFHYDVSGRSTWHVATGPTSLDGSLYSNKPLYAASGGQTLAGPYRGKPTVTEIGKITLAFADKRTGTMIWPGGVVPIERFNIVANGINAVPKANQPETGWWWNPEEDGRGFFMEWQNGTVDIAGYMYDDQGNSVWYLGVYETPDIRALAGNWWSYANGQTMNGAYKPATRVSDNVAPVTVTFSGPDTALMTLPGGRTTQLRRHRF